MKQFTDLIELCSVSTDRWNSPLFTTPSPIQSISHNFFLSVCLCCQVRSLGITQPPGTLIASEYSGGPHPIIFNRPGVAGAVLQTPL